MVRKTICDKCEKEIGTNEEYVSVNSSLEILRENRRVTELGEKEINVFHKRCANKKIIPKEDD